MHKAFISFHHKNDQWDRDKFERLFSHLFINKSVADGEISADTSDDYTKALIQGNYLSDASVCVVLVGKETYKRKHVDWEISGAITNKVGGRSGIVGICLPDHPDYGKNSYAADFTPSRLVDNFKSGYAKYYDWTDDTSKMNSYIEEAFQNRISLSAKADNSRIQFKADRP